MMQPITVIDLRGPQGNVFYILGVCCRLAQQMDLPNWNKQEFMQKALTMKYPEILTMCKERFGLTYIKHTDND